jgi:ABC-2 type transport system permease protein
MTRVLLFVLMGILILIPFLLLAITNAGVGQGGGLIGQRINNLLGLSTALPFSFSLMASFGSVLAIILAASSIGNEYNWKTIRTALISSESRFKFITAKLISLAILVFIGMLIGVVTSFLTSLVTNALGHYAFDFSFATGSYVWEQFLQFWRTFFIIVPFSLLGFMMAIVGRSAMPGIATGIGVYFLEGIITTFMTLAGGWIAKIPFYLMTANANAITALNNLPQGFRGGGGNGVGSTENLPTAGHGFLILSIYAVIFLFLAYYLFQKRDVTGT